MTNPLRLDRVLATRPDPRRDRARRVAASVAVLDAASGVDGHTDTRERSVSTAALEDLFGLDARVLRDVAAVSHREALTDVVARVRDTWSTLRKLELVDAVREVIWADGEIVDAEERLVAWLVHALGLPLSEVRRALTEPV